jgi:hypothetical protein
MPEESPAETRPLSPARKARGLGRFGGVFRGVEVVRRVLEMCGRIGPGFCIGRVVCADAVVEGERVGDVRAVRRARRVAWRAGGDRGEQRRPAGDA